MDLLYSVMVVERDYLNDWNIWPPMGFLLSCGGLFFCLYVLEVGDKINLPSVLPANSEGIFFPPAMQRIANYFFLGGGGGGQFIQCFFFLFFFVGVSSISAWDVLLVCCSVNSLDTIVMKLLCECSEL